VRVDSVRVDLAEAAQKAREVPYLEQHKDIDYGNDSRRDVDE
jgi:hypothetical protein